ncbi:MAG: hypothetical protein ABIB71_02260 [Candidatus Woesearchaeota archaeon]
MKENLLESMCKEVDYKLSAKEKIVGEDIANLFDVSKPDQESCCSFIDKYAEITNNYNAKKDKLESGLNSGISLGRIAWNTIYGAVLGSFFDPDPYTITIGAAGGCALTVYDEVKDKSMNLRPVFWGVAIGGLIGHFITPENTELFPYTITYIGAGLGGALGFLKQWRDTKKHGSVRARETRSSLKKLDASYKAQKGRLLASTMKTLKDSN